jgi:hypothetical protein
MFNCLRAAVVWVLLLALPTQGIAAATMLSCGSVQGARGSEARPASPTAHADAPASAHHAQPGHHDHSRHQHAPAAAHEHPQASTDQDPPQASLAGSLEQPADSKCSVCAICSNAAVVSTALALPPRSESPAPIATAPESHISFLTDGPRRPPRPSLV